MALQALLWSGIYASEYNAMAIKDDSKSEGLSVIEFLEWSPNIDV